MNNKCYWITGLSASGKTTISKKLCGNLKKKTKNVILLDGDQLRSIFKHDKYDIVNRLNYGFIYSNLCKFLVGQNINIIIAIGGLFHELQAWNRINIPGYIEIFLDVPFDELQRRDPKGLYQSFNSGIMNNFYGGDIKPELPLNPDVHLKWEKNETKNQTYEKLCKEVKI
ncbi:adenylyl-sulfate kinase [Alphaproteobacteria bacterium]|jgi:cytidine diphosphoramidate kinase|nr:adenylyl-sulfate kinase [Alphaproteobacteria bacterium]MDC3270702.1 adenylyl-sulfate kinase [Alphaproteobacteria bacterium]